MKYTGILTACIMLSCIQLGCESPSRHINKHDLSIVAKIDVLLPKMTLEDDTGSISGSAYVFGKVLCPTMDVTGDCFVGLDAFAEFAAQ